MTIFHVLKHTPVPRTISVPYTETLPESVREDYRTWIRISHWSPLWQQRKDMIVNLLMMYEGVEE